MANLPDLLARNQKWAAAIRAEDPEFFPALARLQNPEHLWIGCSDSRVPANEILDLLPGQLFVHRNIANVVVHTDLNCLSVIQFAVDVLKIKHILVVGHYGCSGVRAALRCERVGLADNWLRHVQDVREKHHRCIDRLPDSAAQSARLCEFNVIEQVDNVCKTSILRDAWARGQEVTVHGLIYGLHDGVLRDLHCSATSVAEAVRSYAAAVQLLEQA